MEDVLNFLKIAIQHLSLFAKHVQSFTYPVLITAFALFYLSLRKRAKESSIIKASSNNLEYRKKVYKVNQQTIFLLLIHFAVFNPFNHWLPHDFEAILDALLDILLLIPLLKYVFMLPDDSKEVKENN